MEKIEYKSEKGFNWSSKIMEFKLGINAARLLNTLIYKQNYWIDENGMVKLEEGYAFYITISNLQWETNMTPHAIGKAIKILKKSGLIKVKKRGLPAKNHYILNRKAIQNYDAKYKDEFEARFNKLIAKASKDRARFTEESNKFSKDRARFTEESNKISKEDMKFMEEFVSRSHKVSQSAEKSPTGELVLAPLESEFSTVTKNKNTNNKNTNNKTNKKKLTQGESEAEDVGFTDDEVEALCLYESSSLINDIEDDDFDVYENLEKQIIYVRSGIKTPKDFFETVLNKYLKKEFDGFRMSPEDEQLITDCVINNPMFENEDSDLEERLEDISVIREENPDVTDDEILDEMNFDDDEYTNQYAMVYEKLYWNIIKIKENKRAVRFGNLFVGIKEMSENYALSMA